MSRLWLVVACALALGRPAAADAIASSCPGLVPLPWPGSTAVPVNASLWLFGEDAASFTLTDDAGSATEVRTQSLSSDPLAPVARAAVRLRPNTKYHAVLGPMAIDFVTGTTELSPTPPAPTGVAVDLTVAPARHDETPLAGLWITGDFSPMTPIAQVVISAGSAHVMLYVPVAELKQLVAGLDLPVGPATVDIRGVDLAGNVSDPVTVHVTIASDPALDDTFCYGPRGHCGLGPTVGLLVGPVLFIGLAFAIVVIAGLRRLAQMRHLVAPISSLAAEAALRFQLAIVRTTASIGVIGAITAGALGHHMIASALGAFAAIEIITSLSGASMLRLLDRSDAIAQLRGRYLVIIAGGSERSIGLSRAAVVRADRGGVPTSTLNR